MDATSRDVVNNTELHQFEISVEDRLARLTYRVRDHTIELIHTEVPPELEGKGLGSELARAALEYAGHEQLRVIPICPFVRTFIKRHPAYARLIEKARD